MCAVVVVVVVFSALNAKNMYSSRGTRSELNTLLSFSFSFSFHFILRTRTPTELTHSLSEFVWVCVGKKWRVGRSEKVKVGRLARLKYPFNASESKNWSITEGKKRNILHFSTNSHY